MSHREKTALTTGAAVLALGLGTGLQPATAAGALALIVAASTVLVRAGLRAFGQHTGPSPER
ncbi:hypothetical protein [Cellulomonas chengniuliangii]|uniref:MYXO-CTERM domain-containing protein n=1 Tax=Cellulomonas chengniuliangii TaxID=2968084 RepID=A0ABY5KZY1_9CELL|nr:hypothetical protein [Cellulomonas chengniuliangii]MCC2307117.1 hypothetical protein [Cellulomonas chengniuliangii]UUI76085.1 hypothetical protein NP064_04035 [Cellulomonas chengniuliangii]